MASRRLFTRPISFRAIEDAIHFRAGRVVVSRSKPKCSRVAASERWGWLADRHGCGFNERGVFTVCV
jgi:hypothetical protein